MMKKIQLIIWSILVLCVGACTEDKGDYDYIPLNDLVVQGIEKDYTVEQFSSLKIPVTITVKDGFSEDRYEYLWYICYWGVLDEIHCNRQGNRSFLFHANGPDDCQFLFQGIDGIERGGR